jgi:putative toxin-antitoxin system antitoxin component (TIGR02293 family)
VASPDQLIELERGGVRGVFLKDLSERLRLPKHQLLGFLGISKATAARKATTSAKVAGASGYAAIGMAKLLGIAQEIVDNSTAAEAAEFDAAAWLGEWIERPQPALGGRKPSELVSTPTGLEVVARLLGSLESGAYQ